MASKSGGKITSQDEAVGGEPRGKITSQDEAVGGEPSGKITSQDEAVGGEPSEPGGPRSKCSWSPKNLWTIASRNRISRKPEH